jgi:hypothetical protein
MEQTSASDISNPSLFRVSVCTTIYQWHDARHEAMRIFDRRQEQMKIYPLPISYQQDWYFAVGLSEASNKAGSGISVPHLTCCRFQKVNLSTIFLSHQSHGWRSLAFHQCPTMTAYVIASKMAQRYESRRDSCAAPSALVKSATRNFLRKSGRPATFQILIKTTRGSVFVTWCIHAQNAAV